MSTADALRIEDLTVRYLGGVLALRGVDLAVGARGCTAIVGESGSGKSTLAAAVTGLLPGGCQVAGRVVVAGVDVSALGPRERRRAAGRLVGFVDQDPLRSANPVRRVGGHVAEAWRAHGEKPDQGRIVAVTGGLGLHDPGRLRQRPHAWSGGMLQRANVAAATIRGPALVVADEPTSALDADLAADALRTLRSHSRALLLITHDLPLLAAHADHLAILYAGAVVETGPVATVLVAPRHPYTAALNAALPVPGGGLPVPIPGVPPRLLGEPAGCAYAPRCPRASTECRAVRPVLYDGVACHHPIDGPVPR